MFEMLELQWLSRGTDLLFTLEPSATFDWRKRCAHDAPRSHSFPRALLAFVDGALAVGPLALCARAISPPRSSGRCPRMGRLVFQAFDIVSDRTRGRLYAFGARGGEGAAEHETWPPPF